MLWAVAVSGSTTAKKGLTLIQPCKAMDIRFMSIFLELKHRLLTEYRQLQLHTANLRWRDICYL